MQAANVAVENAVQLDGLEELAAAGAWSWVQGLLYWGILALGVLTPFLGGTYGVLFG